MAQNKVLVEVKDLKKYFPITRGIVIQRQVGAVMAVDGISFEVIQGETLGLVGESGCGKSTTGRTILQLYRPTAGEVFFEGANLVNLKGEELRRMRRMLERLTGQLSVQQSVSGLEAPQPPEQPASSQPASASQASAGDAVLDSVMAQFQMLQKDRVRRREEAAESN